MAEGTITSKLVPKYARPKCFSLRIELDRIPGLLKLLKFSIGLFVLLHLFSSFLILLVIPIQFLSEPWKYEIALFPLLSLSIEIWVLSVAMIGIIISDIFNEAITMAVWQRSAIGRILRSFFMSTMLIIFFSICLNSIETSDSHIRFPSLLSTCSPLIFLLVISLVKLIFLRSELDKYWIAVCLLLIAEVAIGIVREDYEEHVDWVILMCPFGGICIVALVASLELCRVDLVRGAAGIVACLSAGSYCLTCALAEDGYLEDSLYYKSTGVMAFVIVGAFFSGRIGELILDIAMGHIETDYFHYVNPPKRLNSKIKSVTM